MAEKKIPAKFTELATHIAACAGAAVTERMLRVCFERGLSATKAGKLIGRACNGYSGEALYTFLATVQA